MLRIYASVGSIIVSTLVLQLGNGMIGPIVVLRASMIGETATHIGLIPAAYGLGFIIGCFWGRQLLHTIGHIRGFAVAAALLTALTLGLQLLPDAAAWIVLRGIMGCGIAVISTCADSWVSNGTPWQVRGRILALYAVTIKCAHFGAPALLAVVSVVNEKAVLLAALFFVLSLVPVALTRMPAPEIDAIRTLSPRNLLGAAPSAFVACFAIGLANGAVLNLVPAHNLAVNLTASHALLLLTAAHVGGLIMQWPIGLLSDLGDRRLAMTGALVAATALAIALPVTLVGDAKLGMVAMFLWGGFALSVYSICLAHAVDHVDRDQTVTACATLLVVWASGAALGPALAGLAMEFAGPDSLFFFGAVCHGAAAAFVGYRLLNTAKRRRQTAFVNVPVSSAEVHLLDPRT